MKNHIQNNIPYIKAFLKGHVSSVSLKYFFKLNKEDCCHYLMDHNITSDNFETNVAMAKPNKP